MSATLIDKLVKLENGRIQALNGGSEIWSMSACDISATIICNGETIQLFQNGQYRNIKASTVTAYQILPAAEVTGTWTAAELLAILDVSFFDECCDCLGGGGSAKDLAPKIVVGNASNGDTLADCDYLDLGDGAQLQLALNDASALGGAMVFLRDGTYLVSSNLSMTGSAITLTGSKNAIIASNVSRFLLLINAANSTVDGIGFASLADSSGVAVITIAQPQVSIKNCTFDIIGNILNPETIAVLNFASASNNFSVFNNEINISNFDDITMECYPAYVLECQYGKFTGNQITGGSGAFLQTCQYMDIDFVGQNLRAANVQDSENINLKVIGDVTVPNFGAGAAYDAAIYIENSENVVVLGCNLVDASGLAYGVSLVNSPNCTINGSLFTAFSDKINPDAASNVDLVVNIPNEIQHPFSASSYEKVLPFVFDFTTGTNTFYSIPMALGSQYKYKVSANIVKTGTAGGGDVEIRGGSRRTAAGVSSLNSTNPDVFAQEAITGNYTFNHAISGTNLILQVSQSNTTKSRIEGTITILITQIPDAF